MRNLSVENKQPINSLNYSMKSSLIETSSRPDRRVQQNHSQFYCLTKQNPNDSQQEVQTGYNRTQKQKNSMYCSSLQFSKQNPLQKVNRQLKPSLFQQEQKINDSFSSNTPLHPTFLQKTNKQPVLSFKNGKDSQKKKDQLYKNINQERKPIIQFNKKNQINSIQRELENISGKIQYLGSSSNCQNKPVKVDQNILQFKNQKNQLFQSIIVKPDNHRFSSDAIQPRSKGKKNTYLQNLTSQTTTQETQSINGQKQDLKKEPNQYLHFKKYAQKDEKEFFQVTPKERRQSKAKTELFLGLPGLNENGNLDINYNPPLNVISNSDRKNMNLETKIQQNNITVQNLYNDNQYKLVPKSIDKKQLLVKETESAKTEAKSFFKKKNPQNIEIIPTITNSQVIIPKNCQPEQIKEIKFKKQDFDIGKIMGKGQFGQVQLVRHKKTGFICGLKTMSKKQIREQKYDQQIARQLSIQFYLIHRNITPLYGYFDDTDNIYLLVEFCPDGHLLSILKKVRRMEEQETSQIIKQICEGIDYVHKQKIIHRDIKPENILFSHGVAKITDFGWAVYRGYGMRKTASGSPLYYSPEIVMGTQYDEKVDIWDIGMMTYQCLLGKVPFRVYTEMDLKRIVSDQVTFPSYVDVSSQAQDFILKILQKKPEDRMTIKEMLRHPFITKYNDKKLGLEVMTDIHKVIN